RLHAHAKATDPLTVAKGCRATERRGDFQESWRHTRTVVVNRRVGLVVPLLARLSEVCANLCRTSLDRVVYMLAQGGRRVIVTHIAKRLDHGLAKEERDGRALLQNPGHDSFTASGAGVAPVQRARISLLVETLIGFGNGASPFVGYAVGFSGRLRTNPVEASGTAGRHEGTGMRNRGGMAQL